MECLLFELLDGADRVGGGIGISGNSVALLAETRKTTVETADNWK